LSDQTETSDIDEAEGAASHPQGDGFRRNRGQRYTLFLDELHQKMVFDWYLEIGCRAGRTFAPVRGNTIAVDPFFKAEGNIITAKRRLFVFQETSDDFYSTGFLKKNGIELSFSFLDGMHLFEFLLRDFMNTEANSTADGVIALHDCVPFHAGMLTRDLDNLPRGPWTGDVWKLIPILQAYRPDLKITVLNCRPTGLVLVSNLNPKSTKLKQSYDRIVKEWVDVDLVDYGVGRFFDAFESVDATTFAESGYPVFDKVRRDPEVVATPSRVTK
jgi:hypothetical protein